MISMAHAACRDMDNDTGADPVEGGIAVVRSTWPTLSLGPGGPYLQASPLRPSANRTSGRGREPAERRLSRRRIGHLGVVQTINTSGLNAPPDDQHVGFERTTRTIKK
jgi:hypothetical protein